VSLFETVTFFGRKGSADDAERVEICEDTDESDDAVESERLRRDMMLGERKISIYKSIAMAGYYLVQFTNPALTECTVRDMHEIAAVCKTSKNV
jgi:hypothetical protein